LAAYFHRIGEVLQRRRNEASFATYALGLMGDGERKSMEPMAARACPNPEGVNAAHERLTYFTRGAEWSDRDVRREAARYALAAMTAREPVTDWIIDDTGFPKQGTHSVGVQRQYSGTIGKIANCQVAASLTIATRTEHVPVDFALYLPESWTEDPSRRAEAHIPDEVTFKTKARVGGRDDRACHCGRVAAGLVLADSAYGDNSEFRRRVRCEGLGYAVAYTVRPRCGAWIWLGRRIGDPVAVGDLADAIGRGGFRRVTLAKKERRGRCRRASPPNVWCSRRTNLVDPSQREAVWLLMEWPHGEKAATDFTATTLRRTCHGASSFGESSSGGAPNGCTRTPRESLGWITTRAAPSAAGTTMCPWCWFASRLSSPSAPGLFPLGGKTATRKASHRHDGADGNPPGAALPGFLHHCAPGRRARPGHMVTRCPLCHRPRSMGPPGAHAREHRRTTPFLNQ